MKYAEGPMRPISMCRPRICRTGAVIVGVGGEILALNPESSPRKEETECASESDSGPPARPTRPPSKRWLGERQHGVSTNGVTANIIFFDRDFLGTPFNLLLYSQKCQGVPLPPICQNSLFLQRPHLVLTPFVRNQTAHWQPTDRGAPAGLGPPPKEKALATCQAHPQKRNRHALLGGPLV